MGNKFSLWKTKNYETKNVSQNIILKNFTELRKSEYCNAKSEKASYVQPVVRYKSVKIKSHCLFFLS